MNHRRKASLSILALALLAAIPGCRSGPAPQSAASPAAANFKTYKLKGKVVSTDAAKGEVTVDHEAIPDYMEAMTMPYKLKDPNLTGELHPGDRFTADLLVSDQDAVLDHIVITAQSRPDYKPAVLYHVPKPGDDVPDFKLLNQSNRTIHLAQFRGKALLITFIYTRCPLPNFCPRMSQNFAQIDKALAAQPGLYGRTHLLSISFDPDYDKPSVLRSYGGAYTGKFTRETFEHWDFAAPARKDLPEVATYFDLGVTPEANNTITHSLSTVLIGPDGKVSRFYSGNEWKPEDVVKDIEQVLAGKG